MAETWSMVDWPTFLWGAGVGLVVGAAGAAWLNEFKWRSNADAPMRILSRGRFYKVHRLDDGP